jgi:hypothetical protein
MNSDPGDDPRAADSNTERSVQCSRLYIIESISKRRVSGRIKTATFDVECRQFWLAEKKRKYARKGWLLRKGAWYLITSAVGYCQFHGYIESAGFIRVALFVTFFKSALIDAVIEIYFADDLSRICIHDDD